MAYREFLPDARLRPLVRNYFQVSDLHHGDTEEHRFLPERLVRLTFSVGFTWQGSLLDKALERMPDALLSGLSLTPLRAVSQGVSRTLGTEIFPWAARQLFGWEAHMLTLDLSLQYPAITRTLVALVELGAWEEARQTLDAWLLALLAERGRALGSGVKAAQTLYTRLGQVKLGTLAEELNLSQRQLERLFASEVGVNAKTLVRLIRFEEVHNRLLADPGLSLAGLAYDLGFADQAHLTREFKALSFMTPGLFGQFVRAREYAPRDPHPMWPDPVPMNAVPE
ncbi:AraC family transcriptional regulator [Deinococcus alpinitundrae]|uniref:AraC family transcriptional regulator n=1 Tax=Deinococcus alpinitundrae TaxID=468913 RepID=UPI0013799987|nr:helix-turn-helix domain-containing protein [Deinococcus alpinitundrae]